MIKNLKFIIKNCHATRYTLHATRSQGSALVAVLVIMAIAILVVTVTMQNVLVDTGLSYNLKKSDEVYNNGVSAIEEARLRLLRDPNFTGETLNFTDGNATINITTINPNQRQITAISRVRNNQYISQLQATAIYDANGLLIFGNIQEIY